MLLSDYSVTRPVFASVISLLLIAFGLVAFDRLPLREYPAIDPPIISIITDYPGAAAAVVETRITEVLEDRVAGIAGIKALRSASQAGRSRIVMEFNTGRDIEDAANDVRDRVSRVVDSLPDEADAPEIRKADSDESVIMWMHLTSDRLSVLELTDYVRRYVTDRFSALDGVARVRVGGGLNTAMKIWLDRTALAARGLTVNDVENALRADNVELPAGSIESIDRQFSVRVDRTFRTEDDFRQLVLTRGDEGYLVRLGDVARIEKGPVDDRTFFRGNGIPMVGIGVIKQSTANTLEVAKAAREEAARLNTTLPEGMQIEQSFDSSIFVQKAISEVYRTLAIATALVVLVMLLFLGSVRAMIVPAVTVPISLIATFIVLWALGFSVNLLTLLALVIAIGLVVDDGIVVVENIHRRIEQGETPLVAAFYGTREVGFAVIATTLALLAVFVPIAFVEGDIGRLFTEFALTMAAAVAFSSLVALTLSPVIASKVLSPAQANEGALRRIVRAAVGVSQRRYRRALRFALGRPLFVGLAFVAVFAGAAWMFEEIPTEYTPREDRGVFFVVARGPEGASFDHMAGYMTEIERRLMPMVESGEVTRLLVRTPRGFGNLTSFNSGIVILVLADWADRRSGWDMMDDARAQVRDLPGVSAHVVMRRGFGPETPRPVQFVVGGSSYGELAAWRDILRERIRADEPGLEGVWFDYRETKPQIRIAVDRDRAGDLGVNVGNVGRTLETILGSRRVTTFTDRGEEYDIVIEGERDAQRTPANIENIYVRSDRTEALVPLANLVVIGEEATARALQRYNRVRALTLTANLADGTSLGDALTYLEKLVRTELPASAVIDYKGESLDFKTAGGSATFVFVLGIAVVFLVLAAQFESFVHPLVIMLTVPLAMAGALLGLYVTDATLNLYSQIGLIMPVGLAAKNGILIVEFANQLRDRGTPFKDAIVEASVVRLRPIVMTGITTAAGSVPLILAAGAGSETRIVIGTVVFSGVIAATLFTLFVVPAAYALIARGTGSPGDVRRRLDDERDMAETDGGGPAKSAREGERPAAE